MSKENKAVEEHQQLINKQLCNDEFKVEISYENNPLKMDTSLLIEKR